jgi:hypothetical protein
MTGFKRVASYQLPAKVERRALRGNNIAAQMPHKSVQWAQRQRRQNRS